MSRVLKFRAWVEEEKWDYYVYDIQKRADMAEWFGQSAIHIEQYTGLKDKNGKEIYEGDICKDQRGYVGKIVWVPNEAGFGFYEYHVRDDGFGLGCMPLSRLRLEILGNIHENPELLEAGV